MSLKKMIGMLAIISCIGALTACTTKEDKYPVSSNQVTNVIEVNNEVYKPNKQGEKSEVIEYVITDEKVMSLTFQGLMDEENLHKLLDELDRFKIKATFFVSGVKVSEEPELAQLILDRGHELGNATLTGTDLTKVDYTKKVIEIKESHEAIQRRLGVDTKYLRIGHGAIDEQVQLASAEYGYPYIIDYSVNPQDWDGKSDQEIVDYIDQYKRRGGIILLNAEKNPDIYTVIEPIYNRLKDKDFDFVSLDYILDLHKERQEMQYVLDENWHELDSEMPYRIIEKGSEKEKKIALTFDDWASDDTVDSILDTLDQYNVKATFFLIGNGVERNPGLAYAIAERGHEVASHTYTHTDLDTLIQEEVKQEVVKAHEVITQAINKEPKRYLRPPRGVINEEIAQTASQLGYSVIMYGPSALDWDATHDAEYITNYMLEHVYNGAILLLHILDGIHTPEALPSILEGLQNQGYTFVTVGELLEEQK